MLAGGKCYGTKCGAGLWTGISQGHMEGRLYVVLK